GFLDNAHKLAEKLLLFKNCPVLVARNKDLGGKKELVEKNTSLLTWGSAGSNVFVLNSVEKQKEKTEIVLTYQSSVNAITIPFVDDASIENAVTCCCVLLVLGYSSDTIRARI